MDDSNTPHCMGCPVATHYAAEIERLQAELSATRAKLDALRTDLYDKSEDVLRFLDARYRKETSA